MASDLFEEMGEDAPVFSPIHLAYFAFHGRANPDDPADGTEGDSYRRLSITNRTETRNLQSIPAAETPLLQRRLWQEA